MLPSQVFYNKVNTATNPIAVSTVALATSSAQYQYSTAISDPSSGTMGALLFPGDATATAAMGFMQTYLLPTPGAWTGPLSFSVSLRQLPYACLPIKPILFRGPGLARYLSV